MTRRTLLALAALAALPSAAADFSEGAEVEARFKHSWVEAKVIEVGRGEQRYKVRYEGFDSSWEQWKRADELRPRRRHARASEKTLEEKKPAEETKE